MFFASMIWIIVFWAAQFSSVFCSTQNEAATLCKQYIASKKLVCSLRMSEETLPKTKNSVWKVVDERDSAECFLKMSRPKEACMELFASILGPRVLPANILVNTVQFVSLQLLKDNRALKRIVDLANGEGRRRNYCLTLHTKVF
jgi:hypothetical protein